MKKEKHEKTTVTVRLTDEEDQVLSRLCTLKKTSKTGYLARLAKDQAKRELLNYVAERISGRKGVLKRAGEEDRPGCAQHYGSRCQDQKGGRAGSGGFFVRRGNALEVK